jgi:tetratricopeptide (TPR) repeat protein
VRAGSVPATGTSPTVDVLFRLVVELALALVVGIAGAGWTQVYTGGKLEPAGLGWVMNFPIPREHFPRALEQAQAILERHPESTRALEVAAIARAETGDRAGARKAFRKLVAAEPDAWVHLNNFALFELQGNDFQAAAGLYERAVDINPRNVVGYQGLLEAARVLRDRDRVARAQAMLGHLGVSR